MRAGDDDSIGNMDLGLDQVAHGVVELEFGLVSHRASVSALACDRQALADTLQWARSEPVHAIHMLIQLLIGTLIICLTIIVEAICIVTALIGIRRARNWLKAGSGMGKSIIAIALITLWMLGGLTISVWAWAAAMIGLELFSTLEEAVYFSIVSFTTLGFGDDSLPQRWRLLSGLIATNGLVLFGLTTAFLFEALDRLRLAQEGN